MISFGLPLAALALTGALTGPQVATDRGPVPDDTMRAAADARRDEQAQVRAEEQKRAVDERARAAEERSREREEQQAQREAARRDREDNLYEQGQDALEESRWQQAVERFTSVASAKSTRADA